MEFYQGFLKLIGSSLISILYNKRTWYFPRISTEEISEVWNEAEGTVEHTNMSCKLWDNIRIKYFPLNWNNCTIFKLLS